MSLFKKHYNPGGEYHVFITDDVFNKAKIAIKSQPDIFAHFKQIAEEEGFIRYNAHDFPVVEIFGNIMYSFELQEITDNIPQAMRIGNIQIGRKDLKEFDTFVDRFNNKIERESELERDSWNRKGMGGKLFSMAAGAAAGGIKKAVTGKSEDVRFFLNEYANYICGHSIEAKEYLLEFATEFGGDDDGLIEIAKCIRHNFWMAEFAKYNRSK